MLLAGEGEEEDGEEVEEGKEAAFVVKEDLDEDEEELLVHAALDSSPRGFPNAGACSSTVSASLVGTDEKAGCSLWPIPNVCSLCRPSQAAGSLGRLGSASPGLHSDPTSAQTPVPVIIPVSAKTLPASARTPASVSVQTAALAPANTLPSGQALGPAPASPSIPSNPSLSLAPAMSPVPGVAERSEGHAGSRGETPRLSESRRPCSAVGHMRKRKMEEGVDERKKQKECLISSYRQQKHC